MKFLLTLLTFLFSLSLLAQEADLPIDFLSKDFHKSRRENLRASLTQFSVYVFFANPGHNRALGIDYLYHQEAI
jgi:Xaa-Pro aminopeptidase